MYNLTALLILGVFLVTNKLNGQILYATPYESSADLKVYLVKSIPEADLLVYKVKTRAEAKGNGLWYLTPFLPEAKKKIYFVDVPTKADLKIFFVETITQIGWRNLSKKPLIDF